MPTLYLVVCFVLCFHMQSHCYLLVHYCVQQCVLLYVWAHRAIASTSTQCLFVIQVSVYFLYKYCVVSVSLLQLSELKLSKAKVLLLSARCSQVRCQTRDIGLKIILKIMKLNGWSLLRSFTTLFSIANVSPLINIKQKA